METTTDTSTSLLDTADTTTAADTTTQASEFAWTDPTGAFNKDWISHLPEALKPAEATLSKYRSVADLAQAHHSLQTLLGKKANAIIPINEKSTPEEIAAYRKALGVPEKPEEYKLKPEKLPEGVGWNDDNGKALAALAHKHNITPAAAKEIVQYMLDGRSKEAQESVLQTQQRVQQEHAKNVGALQDLWKGDFEKNITLATRAALTVGLDPKHPGLADPEIVKAFVRFGQSMSEDKLVRGDQQNGGNFGSPGALAKDIMTNPQNPMYARYKSGEADVVAHVRDLNKRASGA